MRDWEKYTDSDQIEFGAKAVKAAMDYHDTQIRMGHGCSPYNAFLTGVRWANKNTLKEAETKHQSTVGDLMRQITELNRECAELRLRLQNCEGEQE